MKKFMFPVLLCVLFFACKKENTLPETEEPADWNSEKFKSDYTIQFPANYEGGYVQGFEGGWFDKTRDDSHAVFSYFFTNGLQNFDFGDTLANENIDSIAVEDGDVLVFLPNRMDITANDNGTGILFYNELSPISRGELYWKDGGVYKDALTIYYDIDLMNEAVSIIETIQHN